MDVIGIYICFQMQILPGEQGWLLAIRRTYLVYLDYKGKDGTTFIFISNKQFTLKKTE
jgi:hypothetical protein